MLSARFGLARFGATRFGAYSPSLYVAITGSGNLVTSVDLASIEIIDRLNDQVNEARLTFIDDVGAVPGDRLIISLGGSDGGRLFLGVILEVELMQAHYHQRPKWQITARDWAWYLNRLLINKVYTNRSGTEIVEDLITTYAGGSVTMNGLEAGLATVDEFQITNGYLTQALSDLAARLGKVWFVDDYQDLFFGASSTRTGPASLTSTITTYWNLRAPQDLSQVKTRVFVEGVSSKLLLEVPARGALTSFPIPEIFLPVDYAWRFDPAGGTVRIGDQLVDYASTVAYAGLEGPHTCVLNAAASAGATSLVVVDNADIVAFGLTVTSDAVAFLTDDNGHVIYGRANAGSPTTITNIPATGYGSILSDIPNGTPLRICDMLVLTAVDPLEALSPNDGVVVRLMVEDTGAQTALAALEGGDGIHEFFIKSDALGYLSVAEVGQAVLDQYSAAVQSIGFSTRNRLAQSGRDVTVSLAGETNISASSVIQTVRISGFDQLSPRTVRGNLKRWPVRDVEAAPVRVPALLDVIAGPINF